jgi:murein DD-endopeptidase MepM/ murein hydrolase activator NlpD
MRKSWVIAGAGTVAVFMMAAAMTGVMIGGAGKASAACGTTAAAPVVSGNKYSQAQISELWIASHGPADQAEIAGAVGMAESGGDASIVNGIGATGLMQIYPAEPGSLDPATNMRQAVRKYTEAHGWSPWETYTNGDYLKYMGKAAAPSPGAAAPASTCTTNSVDGYINPIVPAAQWGPARTDQGVDWIPKKPLPVLAIGDGVILQATLSSGWPGGGWITYRLAAGAHAHEVVFVAEHLTDLQVSHGDSVHAGDTLATALPGYPWTEWGWANEMGTGVATPYNGAADGTAMPSGKAFARFLTSLGAKPLQDPGPGPNSGPSGGNT